MIPKDIVERIYAAAKIEEVVGDYVSLKRRGSNLWGLCPFPGHTEKTPSFTVNPARNICKCFGCGRGGNAVKFITEMEQCSYPEALRKLAQKYHIEIEEREMTAEEQQRYDDRESMFIVNEWANQWYQEQLWNTEEGQAIGLSYFRERGLRDETIRRFQLGYSPEKGYLLPQAAKQAGYNEDYLTNNPESRIGSGICGRSQQSGKLYDRYHGRVMFPIHSVSGKTVGLAGRIIKKQDDVGKYVNSPESLVYSKTRELYGLYLAKKAIIKEQKCYLVEGQMDCISMSQAGIENVVCSGGTALTKEQIRLIHRFCENVTILYDGDAAGIHAALRGIDMFLEEGLNIRVMLFPDGDDPDSFARKHTAEEFRTYINTHEEDFIRYKSRTLMQGAQGDLRKRSEAVHSIVASIALLQDRITRELYVKDCAAEFGMNEQTLLKEVINERRTHYATHNADNPAPSAPSAESTTPSSSAATPSTEGATEPNSTNPLQLTTYNLQTSPLASNFNNLIRALIRYGTETLTFVQTGAPDYQVLVGDYMQQYLAQTQIPCCLPLYERCFALYNEHRDAADLEQVFLCATDQEVAALATDLLSDQYTLCSTFQKQTTDRTPQQILNLVIQLLYELHFTYITQQIDLLPHRLKEVEQSGDMNAYMQIMQQQQYLISVRTEIANLLGKN